jgi:hypothetical protein
MVAYRCIGMYLAEMVQSLHASSKVVGAASVSKQSVSPQQHQDRITNVFEYKN